MKKYKLQDLVANGSHSRLKVDSDLLVGDINNGYGYGDVLDANATKDVASSIANDKINTAKEELISLISTMQGSNVQEYQQILDAITAIQQKNEDQDNQDETILQQIQALIQRIQDAAPSVAGNNDNLIINII